MILVDTSVWVNHLRRADARLIALLQDGAVICHPFIIGELACGHLSRRQEVLSLLTRLPQAAVVSHAEALAFVEAAGVAGAGIGWVDVHLLAAARLARARVMTADRALAGVAARLSV
jgi:predicted nucleic acid-binding protein